MSKTVVTVEGDRSLPLLTCVHGLMGGPGDFLNLIEPWRGKFCFVLVDMNAEMREGGVLKSTRGGYGRVTYDDAAKDILDFLDREFKGRGSYFIGLSIGGKVIYDLIAERPELYLGGVISDVGPGQIPESDLFEFVEVTIPSINLDQEWPGLKQEIQSKILDKNLRILVQTQVYYPTGKPPAEWKPGMAGLRGMLTGARIKEQWYVLDKLPKKLILLQAGYLSAIPAKDVPRLQAHPMVDLRKASQSAHFVHIANRAEVQNAVLELLTL